jgi:hypothetical protein
LQAVVQVEQAEILRINLVAAAVLADLERQRILQ